MSDDSHSDRIIEIFGAAIELPVEQRQQFIRKECRDTPAMLEELESLLQHHDDRSDLSLFPTDEPDAVADARKNLQSSVPISLEVGQIIGPYKTLERIGEGGFSSVWKIEQQRPIQRTLALKIIKIGMDTREVIARFRVEQQALAMMKHPNIATVFDAGSTDNGRPYFAMELVQGQSIIEYADAKKLDIPERLKLFMRVCHGIQHAHQKGVIHRDIKPSNILVTEHDGVAVPKVIDFGIAKATASRLTEQTVHTGIEQVVGTPAYMSPEQATKSSADVDTRADVYSLGVLLYELLVSALPIEFQSTPGADTSEIMRMIREFDPQKPSMRVSRAKNTSADIAKHRRTDIEKLRHLLRGDLDWIVMMCLEKDRERRYQTVNALAGDIERFLVDEPVSAGPPSAAYKFSKFCKRNRTAAAATMLCTIALLAGLIGTSYGLVQANKQREIAETASTAEAERAQELLVLTEFQSQQLGNIVPEVMGAAIRRSIIDATPEVNRDSLSQELDHVNFTNIGLESIAENVLQPFRSAVNEQFADRPLIDAHLRQALADRQGDLGLIDAAIQTQEEVLAVRRDLLGTDHPDTLASISRLGSLYWHQGQLEVAAQNLREALQGQRRVLGVDHPDTLETVTTFGAVLQQQGKLSEAEHHFRESLEGRRRVLGDDHPATLVSLGNVGSILLDQDKYDEAERYHRDALSRSRRVLGDDHRQTLITINNMGYFLQYKGDLEAAEPYYRESLDGSRRVHGDDHPDTLFSVSNMGFLLRAQGKYRDAEPYYRDALAGGRRMLGREHPHTLTLTSNMGFLLMNLGRLDEAEPYFREALESRRKVLGNEHVDTLVSINNLARLLVAQRQYGEVDILLRDVLKVDENIYGNSGWRVAESFSLMGEVLTFRSHFEEAEERLLSSFEILRQETPPSQRATKLSAAIQRIVTLYEQWGRPEDAAKWQALELAELE